MTTKHLREIEREIIAAIDRAVGYLGTVGATQEELEALDRLQKVRQSGTTEETIQVLVQVGNLQRCPTGYWREVDHATDLACPLHYPCITAKERTKRERFRHWVQNRGE